MWGSIRQGETTMQEHTCSIGFMIAIRTSLLVLPGDGSQQPKPDGVRRVTWEADITGLDPHLSFGMQARHVVGNLFNSPVTIDAELRIIPDLAESWELLENSKPYVFHLRKRAKSYHGIDRPVIAKTALLGQAQPLAIRTPSSG
jgi:ABC-type transport system substrate-binding protein